MIPSILVPYLKEKKRKLVNAPYSKGVHLIKI